MVFTVSPDRAALSWPWILFYEFIKRMLTFREKKVQGAKAPAFFSGFTYLDT